MILFDLFFLVSKKIKLCHNMASGWSRAAVTLGSMRVVVERPPSQKPKALSSWTITTPM